MKQSMIIRTLFILFLFVVLTGCSIRLPGNTTPPANQASGSVYRSTDGGTNFEPKITIDENRSLTQADVLSYAIHPTNSAIIYLGTEKSGLFRTTDSAETWKLLTFPPTRIFGLAVSRSNGDQVYASGIYQNVGRIYRTQDAGENWKEIYSEPGQQTFIASMTIDTANDSTVYAATSAGVVIRSFDQGETWKNVTVANGPVTQIFATGDTIVLTVFQQGIWVSFDGGATFADYTRDGVSTEIRTEVQKGERVAPVGLLTLAIDPTQKGVFYGGADNGIFRTADYGKTWTSISIIESSRAFPTRAIAVNPFNQNEIVYAAGGVFYKSIDGGVKWSTGELRTARGVSNIFYDPQKGSTLFFTLRKF
jgi:photosystem II stability/assembly factor-like uncharacterized protein